MAHEVMGWIGANFQKVRDFLSSSIKKKGLAFDEDVFEETIIKCDKNLDGRCLPDDELMKYLWIAFKNNTLRDLKYSRNNTTDVYPELLSDDPEDKALCCMISHMIRREFGDEIYRLFILHTNGVTYEELQKLTNLKDLKYIFRKVRAFVRENVKGELD